MTLGERRALKYQQKQLNSFNKVIVQSPPMANQPENDIVAAKNREQDEIDYQKQVRFEGEAMNKNILSVSSDPPSLIR